MELNAPLSSEELDELEDFLESDAVPDECMPLAMLDGFMTCLVVGPDTIMPSEWMPVVWGDPKGPTFETLKQAEIVTGLMIRHMNQIARTFTEGRPEYPWMLQLIDDGKASDFDVDDWCLGFLTAMLLRQKDWTRFLECEEGIMAAPLITLGTKAGLEEIEQAADPAAERADWVRQLAPCVQIIFAYWRAMRTSGGPSKWKAPSPRSAAGKHISRSGSKVKKPKRRK
ncbi:MAG: UPF0149 family protein [Candidatus Zixiibacteriota bacterium]